MLIWSRKGRAAAGALAVTLFAGVFLLPLAVILLSSLSKQWNGLLPTGFTFAHFVNAFRGAAWDSLFSSLMVGFCASLLALLCGMWAALALLVHRELLLPAPWTVVRRLCELAATGAFWRITAVSIGRVLLGVAGAVVLGVALATACMISKTADALLRPLMTVVKSTPVASFVVLALIWIARDWLPVFIALLMVLPVVWSNVCTGIRSADPALLELARVYGWPRGRVLRRIYVPSVRPHFLAALRSGLGFGWKAGIAAEVLTVPHSAIGRMIYESKLYLQTTDLFAWTLAVILLSVGLERLVLRALTPRGKGGGSA